ncbi:MAG: deoxyribose-phosphate aldolase [Candidatus Methanofastidiosa archaeon]|nr:deoxyribose-phosphate aldolase [Candidatus Methanofastidiosa archaeon]
MEISPEELASIIDHTQLHADSSKEDIQRLTDEAKRYGFGSVCVNPFWVSTAREYLKGTDIGVVCVVGFPLGQNRPESKFEEASAAIDEGATELDMVINIGALKSQMFGVVESEIRQIADLGVPVKTIIETCYLLPEEKIMACELSMRAGASFIKTSTGFGTYGATREDVSLIRHIVGERMKIKAAGGISSWERTKELIEAGADRIGASKSIQILEELKNAQ